MSGKGKGKGKRSGGKYKCKSKAKHKLENRRVSIKELRQSTQFYDGRKDVPKFGAGDSFYVANFLKAESKQLFPTIMGELEFTQMFNVGATQANPIPRLVAAQSDRLPNGGGSAIYRMPGCNEKNIPTSDWTPKVRYVCEQASKCIKQPLNHCVVSRYRDENDSLAFHHDKLLDLQDKSLILSVSFGDARPILFSSADGKTRQTLLLQSGSLLAIGPLTNRLMLHSIPKLDDPVGERISLSLRSIETFIQFDPNDRSKFVVSGKGAEFQTPNYPFSKSHDDPSLYSDDVKLQMQINCSVQPSPATVTSAVDLLANAKPIEPTPLKPTHPVPVVNPDSSIIV